jgi:hypothetical protein
VGHGQRSLDDTGELARFLANLLALGLLPDGLASVWPLGGRTHAEKRETVVQLDVMHSLKQVAARRSVEAPRLDRVMAERTGRTQPTSPLAACRAAK